MFEDIHDELGKIETSQIDRMSSFISDANSEKDNTHSCCLC